MELAIAEDLADVGDWTTQALVPEDAVGRAAVVARQPGILAGGAGVAATLAAIDANLRWTPSVDDGQMLEPGSVIGVIAGPARGMLMAERLVLNLLGRLSGIATLTGEYVAAVASVVPSESTAARARIYDTRKTTPGWRRLEKYAVRCGGGVNHRTGLYEAILIKDNHLAFGAQASVAAATQYSVGEAVARARCFVQQHGKQALASDGKAMIVEVEVDTLAQLDEVLPAGPDIVLLDNMPPNILREAVARRDACDRSIALEASGGVNLCTVGDIAASGVDRISVGALTHSAVCLDIGLDWLDDA